jgi:hypothetical protein
MDPYLNWYKQLVKQKKSFHLIKLPQWKTFYVNCRAKNVLSTSLGSTPNSSRTTCKNSDWKFQTRGIAVRPSGNCPASCQRSIEAHSLNHCCSGKTIPTTYCVYMCVCVCVCVCVALVIQHAVRIHHIVIFGLSESKIFFYSIS